MEFADIISKLVDKNARFDLKQAEVTATTAGPPATITIQISGDTTEISGIRYLASYTPSTSDIVFCLINKNDILVLGDLA